MEVKLEAGKPGEGVYFHESFVNFPFRYLLHVFGKIFNRISYQIFHFYDFCSKLFKAFQFQRQAKQKY